MHVGEFVRGKGRFVETPFVPTDGALPRAATHCSSRPAGSSASTTSARRRAGPTTSSGTDEDVLEIHPADAEERGIRDGDRVSLASRVGETTLHAQALRADAPGRRVHDVPLPGHRAPTCVTTEYSDWATNCPEYKVTAVQVTPLARTWHANGNGMASSAHGGRTQAQDVTRMANQIAGQFRHLPHDQAVARVSGHLATFWEPRMRRLLVRSVANRPEAFDPLVVAAADALPRPPPPRSAALTGAESRPRGVRRGPARRGGT